MRSPVGAVMTGDDGEELHEGYEASDRPDWRSIDWQGARRDAIVARRRLHYVDLGDGSPIVFVHGTGGCWQNWLENLAPLSLRHRVIALDLPGFGASEMPLERISFEGYADTVLGLSDQLELEAPTLVGHSLGAMVVLEAARRRPGAISAVVMAGGTAVTILKLARHPWSALRRPQVAMAIAAEVIAGAGSPPGWLHRAAVARPRLRRLSFWYVVDHPEGIAKELLWELAGGAGRRGYLPTAAAHRSHRLPGRVDLPCPLVIVHGERDRLVTSRDLDAFATSAPSAEVVRIPNAGHMPQIEMPRVFNQIVLRVRRRHGAPGHSGRSMAAAPRCPLAL